MDNFVTVKKPSSVRHDKDDAKKQERQKFRYNPYGVSSSKERNFEDWKDKKKREKSVHSICGYKRSLKFEPSRILAPLLKDGQSKPSSSALTKHLLNTLGDKSNPITNSTIYERSGMFEHDYLVAWTTAAHDCGFTDHISSAATGHQRSEGRGPHKSYLEVRAKKLAEQLPEKPSEGAQVLRNVRIYINGYLENTTDIEMKRVVALAGGQVLCVHLCQLPADAKITMIQAHSTRCDAHPDVAAIERREDAEDADEQVEEYRPCCETRVGDGQHRRWHATVREGIFGDQDDTHAQDHGHVWSCVLAHGGRRSRTEVTQHMQVT